MKPVAMSRIVVLDTQPELPPVDSDDTWPPSGMHKRADESDPELKQMIAELIAEVGQ